MNKNVSISIIKAPRLKDVHTHTQCNNIHRRWFKMQTLQLTQIVIPWKKESEWDENFLNSSVFCLHHHGKFKDTLDDDDDDKIKLFLLKCTAELLDWKVGWGEENNYNQHIHYFLFLSHSDFTRVFSLIFFHIQRFFNWWIHL